MKKMTATILIATLAATALITQFGGLLTVNSVNNYEAHIGYPGTDTYNFCYHTHAFYSDCMTVGMGIAADYNTAHGDTTPYEYKWTNWTFFSALGFYGSKTRFFFPTDSDNIQDCRCWWKINGIWNEYAYDGDAAPAWQGSGYNQYAMTEHCPSTGHYYLNPYGTNICGKIGQAFQEYYWPYPVVYYIEIQVQPWYIVQACEGPNTNYTGDITYP